MDTIFDKKIFIENFKKNCNKVQIKKFVKGETVTTYISKRNQICVVINGEVDLLRYDLDGAKTIIGHYIENDVFGEAFYPSNTNNELFVIARKNSEILFFTYDTFLTKCKSNCAFHKVLTSSLSELFLDQIVNLNSRIELLTKRRIKEKLLSYFDVLSNHSLHKSFSIPFSYVDLADFLSVDRSAMMRELKLLVDSGYIKRNGNKITLLN